MFEMLGLQCLPRLPLLVLLTFQAHLELKIQLQTHRQVHVHSHGLAIQDIGNLLKELLYSVKLVPFHQQIWWHLLDVTIAATAATAGPDIDVPFQPPSYPLPGTVERIFTPGAVISGLISPYGEGPLSEKFATLLLISDCTRCK